MSPDGGEALGDVLAKLPHAPPFRFLSRLTLLEPGQRAQAVWNVRGSEDFFRGHFPGDPIVPGVLISEALAQLSGLVGIHGGPATSGRLVHVDVRFDQAVRPPAELVLRSTLTHSMGALRRFDVAAVVGETAVARGTLTLAAVDQQSEV